MQPVFHQEYNSYTHTDRSVWSTLYERQLQAVNQHAYSGFTPGLHDLGFHADEIPSFDHINHRLWELTGWKIYAVPGLLPNRQFFKLMVFKRFGATTWLRKPEQLDYLEEPDMFHDVFGHVPLLTDPTMCEYLHGLATVAERFIDDEEVIEAIARLYWYTVEFGLVKENAALKIYGAGILSSIGETRFVISPEANLQPFDLDRVLQTPYIKDSFQEQYFVLDSLEQLAEVVYQLDELLSKRAAI